MKLTPEIAFEQRKAGLSAAKIASAHGVSWGTVYLALRRHPAYDSWTPPRRSGLTPEKALAERKAGLSVAEIASSYAVGETSVYRELQAHPDYDLWRHPQKRFVPTGREITSEKVFAKRKAGWPVDKIALWHGVSKGAVYLRLNGHPDYKQWLDDNRWVINHFSGRGQRMETLYGHVSHLGRCLSYREWAFELGISTKTFASRVAAHRRGEMSTDRLMRQGSKRWGLTRPHKRSYFTYEGERLSQMEWAARLNITITGFRRRLEQYDSGRTSIEAVMTPGHRQKHGRKKYFTHQGTHLSYQEWALELGIDYGAFYERIRAHLGGRMSLEDLMTRGLLNAPYGKCFTYQGVCKPHAHWGRTLNITSKGFRRRLHRYHDGLISLEDLMRRE